MYNLNEDRDAYDNFVDTEVAAMHQDCESIDQDATFGDIEAMVLADESIEYSPEQEVLINETIAFTKSNPTTEEFEDYLRCISAKGGSGKTECVFEAVRRIKASPDANMYRFFAMSYTNKAVKVMYDRILKMDLKDEIKCQTIHKTLCRIIKRQ